MSAHTDPPDPDGGVPNGKLKDAHARMIRATFTQVNDLLTEVSRVGEGNLTPFDRRRADISPLEARRLAALVAEMRERMLTALDELGIPRPEPESSARWSASTAFLYAEIALSELSPETLRGFGAMDEAAAASVTAVANELRKLANRGQALLGHGGSRPGEEP